MRLGDRVRASAILQRRSKYDGTGWGKDRFWKSKPMAPRNGVFIGWRTLSNGHTNYNIDEPADYTPKEYFRTALVVFSERENPVYVPLDALEAIDAATT